MLRRFLNFQSNLTQAGKPLARYRPLTDAIDHFIYEPALKTTRAPHIRDMIDLKRWMVIVVIALLPCTLMAIWNSGLQKWVYGSFDPQLMADYLRASESFSGYFAFATKEGRYWLILKEGCLTFLPVLLISYAVGGFWEVVFAIVRRHDISEGFLVTGILFALILPSTIPYWMVAVGISAGVIIGKEIFGGTGMNILNPALVCRAFLFFSFPTKMTGDVWVGTNPTLTAQSLQSINVDGYSQATPLNLFNISSEIKRIHIDTLALAFQKNVPTLPTIQKRFTQWQRPQQVTTSLGNLSSKERKAFVTDPIAAGGLGLPSDLYLNALRFTQLRESSGLLTNSNFFFGNRIGSLGETSILGALIGALVLLVTGIGSWRIMLAVAIGSFLCATLFQLYGSMGPYSGAFQPAKYAFPAYKHFFMGSLVFGLIFMATEPVSSPGMQKARWVYGFLIGIVVIVIRVLNPAFPEGVMLAILFGNVFTPLLDHFAVQLLRKRRHARRKALIQS
ncbi:MAG: NADH:ubiquinone reductase (Na(+)-transporting) subunit B [Chlamydiota bacterium]